MMNAHFKPLPTLTSDAEAEDFVEMAELSEYDLSGFTPMSFDIEPKSLERSNDRKRPAPSLNPDSCLPVTSNMPALSCQFS